MSHTGGLVVLAVCDTAPVGADIEMPGGITDLPDLADLRDLVLSPEEITRPTRDDELLRIWVRKEAVLKAAGVGLTVGMDTLTMSAADRPAELLRHALDVAGPISVTDVDLPGAAPGLPAPAPAAVAVLAGGGLTVTVRDGTPLVRP